MSDKRRIFVSSVQREFADERRAPHASIPHNPLIAEPLFLTRYIEKAGTGILDMIKLCKVAGLPAPQFRQEGGQFIQVLRRPRGPRTAQVTAQVGGGVEEADKLLWELAVRDVARAFPVATAQVTAQVALFCREPRSAREIMAHLELRHWKTFQANYLIPLLKAGLLTRTIPNKPTSRLQKYLLTEEGRAWLAGLKP